MKTLENLKYPIGKFEIPASFNKESIEQWISIIREFPQKIPLDLKILNCSIKRREKSLSTL